MEVIRINRERIKIMLSPNDMAEMDIDCTMLDTFDKRGKEAFGKIMQEARDRCGFISCGRKIFVQVFPSKDGGCEMFITKMNDGEIAGRASRRRTYCYRFNTIEGLLGFCAAIRDTNYTCDAYRDIEKTEYYIKGDERSELYGEFGGTECSDMCTAYISERCKLICEDAGTILGRLG